MSLVDFVGERVTGTKLDPAWIANYDIVARALASYKVGSDRLVALNIFCKVLLSVGQHTCMRHASMATVGFRGLSF